MMRRQYWSRWIEPSGTALVSIGSRMCARYEAAAAYRAERVSRQDR